MKPIYYKILAIVVAIMTIAFLTLPYLMSSHPGEQPTISKPVVERN